MAALVIPDQARRVCWRQLPRLTRHPCFLPQALDPARSKCVVKGDSKVYAIAAASIIAKVTRDRIMLRYAEEYPGYGFEQHKGYGVPAHVKAIRDLGPSPIHRRTFAPVKTWFPAGKAAPKERK